MTRFSLAASVAILILATVGCSGSPAPAPQQTAPPGSSDQLDDIVEHYWEEYLELNPLRATAGGDHRHDDQLENSSSPQFLADSLALERRALAELLATPVPAPNTPARLTYEVFKRERELAIEGYTYPEELFPVNPFEGMAQDFALMGSGAGPQPFLTQTDYENWLLRIDAYVLWSGQAIDNMRSGMRRGYLAPRALIEAMLPQFAALGNDTPDNPFFRPLHAVPASISGPARERISERLTAAVKDKILPAYRNMHDFLQNAYLPLTSDLGGLSRLPLGEAWYAYLVRRQTNTRLTPAEVHRLGVVEVERVRGRMQAALNEAGFSGDAQAYFELLRHDSRYRYGSAEEMLNAYRDLQSRLDAAVPNVLAALPQAPAVIRAAARFRETLDEPLSYRRATPDGNFPATLDLDTAAAAARMGFEMEPLLLNAYLPGRHAQFVVQSSRSELPRFRRFGAEPAFVDGWALYAQSLGAEMGLSVEPAAKFGALLDELCHAAIVVVDSGLHADAWTRRQAIDYLHAQLPIDDQAAAAAVDRSLALPARALAAEIGAMRFHALRSHAQEKLGSRFDLRAFHSAILEAGALPLDLLEQRIDQWIDVAGADR
jgi:uncharacterized protein (DUF885 family)